MAESREIVRCKHCRLNQYLTKSGNCRRCSGVLRWVEHPFLKPLDTPPEPLDETFIKPPEPQRGMTEAEFKEAMDSIRGVTIG